MEHTEEALRVLKSALLGEYQVRKTRTQKAAFAAWAAAYAQERGWRVSIEESAGVARSRNIVIGDAARASTLITAHYDTCARLPFPNILTPQCWPLIVLAQLPLLLMFFVLGGVLGYLMNHLMGAMNCPAWVAALLSALATLAIYAGMIGLMIAGPANPHTANDNTSGVALVLLALEALRGREDVAFVLFDNEEKGMLGSAAFVKAHPQTAKRAVVINADCVSDGDTLMLTGSKASMKLPQAKRLGEILRQTVPEYGKRAVFGTSPGTFYPSDQMMFARGIGMAAFQGKRLLYVSRIHTARDTVFDDANLCCLLCVLERFFA